MSQTPIQSARPVTPRISIIGAGVAGLALACHLQARKIPFSIYEARNAQTIGHSYAITLQNTALRSLKHRLPKEYVVNLRQNTAVDRAIGGNGNVSDQSAQASATFQAVDRDFRKWLVGLLVKQGGRVDWNHKLTAIETTSEGSGAALRFHDQRSTIADIIIDAGGLRSPCFDYNIEAAPKPRLLPYATYYGVRRMKSPEFLEKYSHYFKNGSTIDLLAHDPTTPFISLQKVHQGEVGQKEHDVELRWVYSRPAKEGSDPLYRPGRTPDEAKKIPPELYDEILTSIQNFSPKKRSMLQQVFNLSDLHSDRILNWHLRIRLPQHDYFVTNTLRGVYQVFSMGDAAHSFPIVKSSGAGEALKDARHMAECLDAFSRSVESPGLVDGVRSPFRYANWLQEAQDAIQRLRTIHGETEHTEEEMLKILGLRYQKTDTLDEISDASSEAESTEKGRL